MANVTITQLPAAGTLTGTELVPIVQNGVTVRTTTGAITSGPSLTQTFLTLNNEPSLANSRYFSVGNGLGLTDNGAQSSLLLSLTGASASLNTAGNGFAVKTGLTTVVSRTLTTANSGLSVTNGDGASGNPVFSLTGTPLSLANLSGGGFVVALDPSTLTQRIIAGTSNQISVADGDGVITNPTISISNDAVFPGNQGIVVPSGGTAQRAGVPLNGTIRYNTDSLTLEAYSNNNWGSITVGGGVTYINVTGGTTGLTTTGGPVTSVGTIVFGGTLITTNGGTGLSSYTAGDIVYYASGTAFSKLAIGTNGQVLTSTGTAPQWTTLSSVSVTTFSAGTTGFTPNTATGGAVTLSGTLNVANGGTGATNLTGYVKGSGTSAFTASSTIPGADISGNISGNAANVTGTVLVANGGTGANTLTGYVKGSGTSAFTASATIPGTDVSGNISGNAANVTGVVAVGNGGTGATTLTGYVKGSGTSAMTASSTIPNTDVTGLGTMSTQAANNVAITGGAINGTTVGGTTPAAGTFTSVAMTTGTITTTPTNGTDIVNKTYVDSISAGINFHQACRLATATALPSNTYNNGSSGVGATLTATANGALSVDATLVVVANRILVKNQANQAYNGVYTVTQVGDGSNPFILTRATDYNTAGSGVNQIDAGDFFLITAGATLANTSWVQQTPLPITVGTTALVFSQFGAPITYSAGTGLSESPAYTFNIANTGVTSGNYGGASTVPALSINAQGQITSATNTSIAIAASQVTSGQLAIAQGGTNGSATPTAGAVPYGTGTAYAFSAAGTSSQVLLSGGTGSPTWTNQSSLSVGSATTATNLAGGAANRIAYQTGAAATSFITAPSVSSTYLQWNGSAFVWASAGTGSVTSVDVSGGTTGLTTSGGPITTSGTITLTGTLVASNGGTGQSTYTTGDILYASSSSALSKLGIGTNGQVLTSSGTAPQYVNQSSLSVGSATNATNTAITDDTTNATMYPTWVTANTGNLPQKVTSTKLTFNPSTGVLTVTGGISGGTF